VEDDAQRIKAGLQPQYSDVTSEYLDLTTTGRTPWQSFRQSFEQEYLAHQRERTREKALMVLDIFEQSCRPATIQDVTERTTSAFAAALASRPVRRGKTATGKVGLAPWSIRNYLAVLRTALRWAERQKLIPHAPKLPEIKVPKLRPKPVEEEDWQALIASAPDERWKAYLLCGWYGGLRLSEARHLRRTPSDEYPWLDLRTDRIILPARFVKSDEDQWVPLHPTLRAALTELPDQGDELFDFRHRRTGEPLSRNGITSRVLKMAARAGVRLSMHRLRKGFGCRIAQQLGRGNAPVLHRLMRHSSMQVTMEFYASTDPILHEAIGQLDLDPSRPMAPDGQQEGNAQAKDQRPGPKPKRRKGA
jgi:integrase